jgi:hypothetical protein
MKREDLKKRLNVEKPGLNQENYRFFFLLIFLIVIEDLHAQIPINGFCRYNSFQAAGDLNCLLSANFYNDSLSDFILYSSIQNKFNSLIGKSACNFSPGIKSSLPFPISKMIPLSSKKESAGKYVFISRKAKIAGIIKLDYRGMPVILRKIKLDSYPDQISSADIDGDGNKEFLISGSAFNGLSILKQTAAGLIEKKIITGIPFSQSVLIDLNNDSFADIAAYNLSTNKLQFYYNNSRGEFSLVREINMDYPIHSLQAVDFNNDSYPDLIFSSGNNICVMFGDQFSSYSRQLKIETQFQPDKFICGDFNKDKKIDIAYINKKQSLVSVLFNKNGQEFYPELHYLEKTGLTDITYFTDKLNYGIAAYSKDGYVYSISNIVKPLDEIKICFGGTPGKVIHFDYMNEGITDIAYLNTGHKSLDLILRNREEIPSIFFSIPVENEYSEVLVERRDKTNKAFYLYNKDERLIEIINFDLDNFIYRKDYIYNDGLIKDIRITKGNNTSRGVIQAALVKDGRLDLIKYYYNNYKYLEIRSTGIDENVIDAKIDKEGNLFYWKQYDNVFSLVYVDSRNPQAKIDLFSKRFNGKVDLNFFLNDFLSPGKETSFSILTFNGKMLMLFANDKNKSVVNQQELKKYFSGIDEEKIFLSETNNNSIKKLFLYLEKENSLNLVNISKGGKEILLIKVMDCKDLKSYFIRKIFEKKLFIVYSDSLNDCLVIKKI